MGLLNRLTGLFSRAGRNEGLLQQAIAHAKAGRPQQAIAIYDSLLKDDSTSATAKASALFNRALAYSSLNDDDHAIADLQEVLAMPGLPENVQTAARSQLARVKRRATK